MSLRVRQLFGQLGGASLNRLGNAGPDLVARASFFREDYHGLAILTQSLHAG